jgi:copper(I)-binding protein
MFAKRLLFVALAMLLASCQPASGVLEVNDAWARPAATGENSAAYFVIENGTGEEDTLLTASADIASAVELHTSMSHSMDVMEMKMLEEVPIPNGKTKFEPGGLHVMFVGLTRDLRAGDVFELTLNFQTAGEMKITVSVKEP